MKRIQELKIMKLKEINNLFGEIKYFTSIVDRDDYYNEFLYLFGERELLKKVENIFIEQGTRGVGKLFNLKTKKWVEFATLETRINKMEPTDSAVTTRGTKVNKGGKTRKTNTNNTSEVVPFDVVESIGNEVNENIVDEEKGVYNEDGSINVNPNSLTVIKEAYVEPELEKYDKEDSFQFMRTGYFCLDSKDSTKEHMVFNRIVSLKSSYKPN